MKQITAYKTTDGRLFEDRQKAQTHERKEGLKGILTNFFARHHAEPYDEDHLVEMIDEHGVALWNELEAMFERQKDGPEYRALPDPRTGL